MVIGIGCDLVEHDITKKLKWQTDEKIRSRIFSDTEIDLCPLKKHIEFLSGRFAVKEAVVKCLGTGMKEGISLTDIQVLKSNRGLPVILLSGQVKEISDRLGIHNWLVTISHASKYSIAFVVAES
jgi:holo-[acyl-carrier protein] synthase